MCDPVTMAVVSVATTAASAGAGFMGQQSQQAAQAAEFKQNQVNAQSAYADSSRAITTSEIQTQDQASQQRQQDDMATRAAQATATAGAAAGGVQGISVNELVGAFSAKDALAKGAINTNEQWQLAQDQSQKVAAGDQMVGRINSMSPGVPPSPLAAGLGIISGGINAATGLARTQSANGGTMPNSLFGLNSLAMMIPGAGNTRLGQ